MSLVRAGVSEGMGSRARLAWAVVIVLLALLAEPSMARAAAGTYLAVQCHDFDRSVSEVEFFEQGGYAADTLCSQSQARLQLRSVGLANGGAAARFAFAPPQGTEIAGFSMFFDGRSADGSFSQVAVIQGGGAALVHRAANEPGDYVTISRGGLGASALIIELACANNPPCSQSDTAHAWVRNVVVELRDHADPSISAVGGSLVGGGWLRGKHSISASAGDVGAGVLELRGTVNGDAIVSTAGDCGGGTPPYTANFDPCKGTPVLGAGVDTATAPFGNGENQIELTAIDYAGNRTTFGYVARVDNAQPRVVFDNAQDPDDPELIRALVADDHSGIADATLYLRPVGAEDYEPLPTRVEDGVARARVDSLARPPGDYEFRIEVVDVAGNTSATTIRRDGTPMRLTFPLKQSVALRGALKRGGSTTKPVHYGTRSEARGLLLDAGGQPIPGQAIKVVEHFGDGALIRERVSEATTNSKGRWQTKLPAGPSRIVEAFYGGSGRFAAHSRVVGTFAVRSRASFEASDRQIREGGRIAFAGKVGHRGARIPSGGKLIELQVQLGAGSWDTIGEAFRTDDQGRYQRGYRFGKHYTSDAHFVFRVKIGDEGGWPYRRAATKHRQIIVRAR